MTAPATVPTGPAAKPAAAPAAAPPSAVPTPVPTGCEPGSPVMGSSFRSRALVFLFAMVQLLARLDRTETLRRMRAKAVPRPPHPVAAGHRAGLGFGGQFPSGASFNRASQVRKPI